MAPSQVLWNMHLYVICSVDLKTKYQDQLSFSAEVTAEVKDLRELVKRCSWLFIYLLLFLKFP